MSLVNLLMHTGWGLGARKMDKSCVPEKRDDGTTSNASFLLAWERLDTDDDIASNHSFQMVEPQQQHQHQQGEPAGEPHQHQQFEEQQQQQEVPPEQQELKQQEAPPEQQEQQPETEPKFMVQLGALGKRKKT